MRYSIKQLERMYVESLSKQNFDVKIPSQTFDTSTYNDYTYQRLMKQFETLYSHTDSCNISEQFLKGD